MKRPSLLLAAALVLLPMPSVSKTAIFWETKQQCLGRQIEADKIARWVAVSGAELQIAELDAPSVKDLLGWTSNNQLAKDLDALMEKHAKNIQLLCSQRYP